MYRMKVSTGEPLLSDRSARYVVWVDDAKRIPQLADVRTDKLRVLQCVTVYRTTLFCPHLALKKTHTKLTQTFPRLLLDKIYALERASCLLTGYATCGQ